MKNIWIIVGIITLFIHVADTQAQGTCEDQLNLATEEFNAGRYYGIPAMLKGCIDNGFTKEQLQRAYLLLTQVYLLMDDPIGAESSYLRVLRANPEYETSPERDPIDIVYLSKQFTAAPIFSIYGRVGGNTSVARVIYNVYPSSGDHKIVNTYELRPGWQVAVGADWHFKNKLSLNAEVNYVYTSYKRIQKYRFELDRSEFIDKQTWLNIPIGLRYMDNKGKFRPYVLGGYMLNILLSDKGDITIENRDRKPDGSGTSSEPAQSPTINFNAQRNKMNYSFYLGAGMRYKWKLDYLFAEVRYAFGMTNIVNGKNIFSSAAMQQYGHVDDYFRLDNLSVSVGFVRPLYKPRKLKSGNGKSILRFIKKKSKA